MKAVVLSLACCCIWSGSGELLLAAPPAEFNPPATVRPQSSRRAGYDRTAPIVGAPAALPVQQSGSGSAAESAIAPVPSHNPIAEPGSVQSFDIAEPSRASESITRPWEVPDSPRPLHPQAATRIPQHPTSATDTQSVVTHGHASPAPASSFVSPPSPARPATQKASGSLLGSEAEYRERDGFTFSVRTTNITGQTRTARSATPRTARAPRPLEVLKPTRTKDDGKIRSAAAPRPLTTSSNLQPSAPSRWFRPNPLRDSSIAQTNLRSQPYVQQASAQSPEGETQNDRGVLLAQEPPATEAIEDVPSIGDVPSLGDEQPLPFDLNSTDKEASAPTEPAAKMPAEEKASPALEDDLSLDDLPFGDTEKKESAETTKPAVDASTTEVKPNAEPKSDTDSPFPFDLPAEEKKTAEPAPLNEEPADQAPMLAAPADNTPPEEKVPTEELPFGDSAVEATPAEAPATQPTVSEASDGDAKSILAVTTSIAPPAGELPVDHSQGSSEEAAVAYCPGQASRGWSVSEYNWKATGMFHQPLYFEEVNLERYGYSHGIAQPAISYGQFLVNVIAMPYKVMAEPPREEAYTLGHYRPGNYAPYRIHYPPASVSGGLFEAGVVIGLVFLIP